MRDRRSWASTAREIRAAYPPLADGRVLLPFPRLFIVAARDEAR